MAGQKMLPVFKTVGEAVSYSLKNIGVMFRLIWVWAVILVIATVALLFLSGDALEVLLDGASSDVPGGDIAFAFSIMVALFLLYIFAFYSVAVGWHRALLLGEQPGWLHIHAGRREFAYLGYVIALAAISGLPMMVVVGVATGAGVLAGAQEGRDLVIFGVVAAGFAMAIALFVRLFLVLPGAAVGDQRMSLRRSWTLTSGNAWRIFGGLVLLGLINGVGNAIMSGVEQFGDTASSLLVLAGVGLAILVSIVTGFIGLSYLSYCYWFFVPPPEEGDLA